MAARELQSGQTEPKAGCAKQTIRDKVSMTPLTPCGGEFAC